MTRFSFFQEKHTSNIQHITRLNDIHVYVKREDEIHPVVSGNKFRKLKYNLLKAQHSNHSILSFGGAYSNHIAAIAEACHLLGISSTGIIRGEELAHDFENTLIHNPTLKFAHQQGMQLYFVSRADYRLKQKMPLVKSILKKDPSVMIIPEGGTNRLAIKGCQEILNDADDQFDYICSSVGTGGTFAGLIEASKAHQQCIGFSALKGDFLKGDIAKWTTKTNWKLEKDYHFGGYAKVTTNLINFINQFQRNYKIPLDPVYTGKLFYGIFEKIEAGDFPKNTRILAVHTGGLQGNEGMNQVLKLKGLQTIERL